MSTQVQIPASFSVSLGKSERAFTGGAAFNAEIMQHLVEHGLKQKLGDAYNTHKGTEAEKMAQAQKVWDALVAGTLRASVVRTGDPVKRRALEIATQRIMASAGFKTWLTTAKLKAADPAARKMVAEKAKEAIANEANGIMAQAKADVDAASALGDLGIEF